MSHTVLQPENIDESISALRGAFKRTWFEFCSTTSIHGLKYTKDKDTNKYIRFIWFMICLVSFTSATLMVYDFYVDFRSNPTRMNVANDYAPVSNIQFPPTIICPEVMFDTEKSIKYLQDLILPQSLSANNITDLLEMSYGFMYDDQRFDVQQLALMDDVLELNQLSVVNFMRSLSWDCEDLLYKCRFKRQIIPCESLFQTVRTNVGFCCGFNVNQTGTTEFLNEMASGGFRSGLSLALYYNDSMYDRIKSFSLGFKVMFQEANAFPSAHSVNKFIPLNQEVFVSVTPTETFSSEGVKGLPFEDRQCTYPYENMMKYFKSYVAANCELNCRVSMMVKYCGCYTFFFNSNRTDDRICTFRDIPCLVKNFANLAGRLRKYQCACYNSCEKFEYTLDASSCPFNRSIPKLDKFYQDLGEDFAVVHIYVHSEVYRRIRHDLLSNMVSLVSNLGSAFSLFVGMSMISTVEIVFFFTVILRKSYRLECIARHKLLIRKQLMMKERKKSKTKIIKSAEGDT